MRTLCLLVCGGMCLLTCAVFCLVGLVYLAGLIF